MTVTQLSWMFLFHFSVCILHHQNKNVNKGTKFNANSALPQSSSFAFGRAEFQDRGAFFRNRKIKFIKVQDLVFIVLTNKNFKTNYKRIMTEDCNEVIKKSLHTRLLQQHFNVDCSQ